MHMRSKKLLVVIDYQVDFVTGSLGFPEALEIDSGIAHCVQGALAEGHCVLFTYDTHGDEYLSTREGKALPIRHCAPNTDGWRLYGKTQEQICETCATHQIYEVRKSCFGMQPRSLVDLAAQIGDPEEIKIVGVVTNLCVLSNAVMLQAQWPDAAITVDASLCRAPDPTMHEKALDILEGLQIRVINR